MQTIQSSMLLSNLVFPFTALAAHLKPEPSLGSGLLDEVHEPEKSFKFLTNLQAVHSHSFSCATPCFVRYTSQMADIQIIKSLINISCSDKVRSLSHRHKL